MPKIGIIDDRKDLRETLKRSIEMELLDEWTCVDCDPLQTLEEYPYWINENEVCVLLLDERLHEQIIVNNNKVNYNGHDVVEFIRKLLPTLPIFVVTTYVEDDDLVAKFGDVEEIIKRETFVKDAEKYVPRFIRAAQKYLETFESELTELSEKSRKIAQGQATEDDLKRAEAIQLKIGNSFPYESLRNRSEWLNELNKKLIELEYLKINILAFLNNVKK